MVTRIAVLPDALADQIAAGEVVERPASVVKELIENALDAGATRIDVELDAGGRERIRVSDDGSGMSPQDAALSVRRHATSKLRSADELMSIATLGFRGEALPSIASVSRLTLTTRDREQIGGTRVQVDGGGPARVSEIGCAPGTSVEVRDLFYNVPARLKFLKSRPTETGHVSTVCLRAALANPGLTLSLKSDGRRVRELLRAGGRMDRARSAFEGERLRAIEDERDGVRVNAALGLPERARSGLGGLHLFVDGRPVRDTGLARAVSFAYGSVLPPGRYPIGVLWIDLPSGLVDVNVHPQKAEVRFEDARRVYDAVTRLLAKHLGTTAWSGPRNRGPSYWDARLGAGPSASRAEPAEPDPWGLSGTSPGTLEAPSMVAETVAPGLDPFGPRAPPQRHAGAPAQAELTQRGFYGSLRVLGQARSMLLVCEGADALYVIDQHAADERIRYDRLERSYRSRAVQTQALLFPERVELTDDQAVLVEEHAEQLAELGLECRLLGPTTAAVSAVPTLLSRAAPERLLRDVLAELEREGERSFSDAIDMALATMACHAAIRGGDPLSIEQAEALLRNLDQVEDFGGHCPHGRPVVQRLGFDELERRLGR